MSIMYLQKDSLKIVDNYVVDFNFNVDLRQYSLPRELNDSIFVSGDYWNIKFCYFYSNRLNTGWRIELTHSDLAKSYNGSWSVTLLGLEAKNNVSLCKKSLDEKIDLQCRDSSLYSIAFNSMATLEVKIILFPSTQDNIKEVMAGGVLSNLRRKFTDIARTSDIMIIAGYDNSNNIPVHKAILTLRSPVFQAMFDSKMSECNTNQVQISDFDADTIKRMVEFMYKDTFTGIDDTSYEDFISLLAIANKYEIISLKEASSRYLSKMITLHNIADMRNKAILYDSATLLNDCLHRIKLYQVVQE